MEHLKHFDLAISRVEAILNINALGNAAKEWQISTDTDVWVYGSLQIPDTHSLRIKLGVDESVRMVPWQTLKGAMRLMSIEKRS